MSKWFDLFKEGTHTDTAGRQHKITVDDVRTIERKFNESSDDSPIVVGHPKDNAPAFGWLKRVRAVVDKNVTKLQGLADQVVPEFAEAVGKGMYKKVSISLRPDWTIRHVGFLGGVPPAVKGLDPVLSFSEDPDAFEIEFAEGELNFSDAFVSGKIRTIGGIIQRIRDWMIQKDGVETADKIVSQFDIDWLREDPPAAENAVPAFSESTTPVRGKEDNAMSKENKPDTPAIPQPGEFAERVTALEGENATLKKENEALKRKALEAQARDFVERVGQAGKLPSKYHKAVTEILTDMLADGVEINCSETEK